MGHLLPLPPQPGLDVLPRGAVHVAWRAGLQRCQRLVAGQLGARKQTRGLAVSGEWVHLGWMSCLAVLFMLLEGQACKQRVTLGMKCGEV